MSVAGDERIVTGFKEMVKEILTDNLEIRLTTSFAGDPVKVGVELVLFGEVISSDFIH